jgi:hypothetical protein
MYVKLPAGFTRAYTAVARRGRTCRRSGPRGIDPGDLDLRGPHRSLIERDRTDSADRSKPVASKSSRHNGAE